MILKNKSEYEAAIAKTRNRRMKWWNEARYGMFVHWGLYAQVGRNEWVQSIECIPPDEYEKLADSFKPKKNAAREWAKLAKDSGMKYMVLTTKHHEGYCLWDTKQTDYNAVKTGPGRDLVAEYVAACREYGLGVGFYYSLMDWHHPDGAACAYDPEARKRFLDFTKACVMELMSNYGKIDILWYDVSAPMRSHEGWDSLAMNQQVRKLQPHIIINDRSVLDEDFSTPEGHVKAAETGRGWEACMTFNDVSWGYMPSAAVDAHSARDILKMLNTAAGDGGNLLLNIGPAPDGSVPEESIVPLKQVGAWLKKNGEAVYGAVERAPHRAAMCASGIPSQKGNKLYFWFRYWPGKEVAFGGLASKLKSASFLTSGKKIDFQQKGPRIVLKNLPVSSPDKITGYTIVVLEFASKPKYELWATTPALNVTL